MSGSEDFGGRLQQAEGVGFVRRSYSKEGDEQMPDTKLVTGTRAHDSPEEQL